MGNATSSTTSQKNIPVVSQPLQTKQPHKDDGKVYFSYADVHETVNALVPRLQQAKFEPTVIIAIGGGGFIPARILRTTLKIPILAVSLELYNDNTTTPTVCINTDGKVKRLQWFDDKHWPGNLVKDGRVLIVDEVDDTRTTLQYCVAQVLQQHAPAAVAVAVVHNKLKAKRGTLPESVLYLAGQDVPDYWNCYPWDAAAYGRDIYQHEALAQACNSSSSSSNSSSNSNTANKEEPEPKQNDNKNTK